MNLQLWRAGEDLAHSHAHTPTVTAAHGATHGHTSSERNCATATQRGPHRLAVSTEDASVSWIQEGMDRRPTCYRGKSSTPPRDERVRSRLAAQRSSGRRAVGREGDSLTHCQDEKTREKLWRNKICIFSQRVESAAEGQPGGNINLR